jgi:hypothetical protein
MSMDKAQAAEPIHGNTNALEVGQFNATIVADHYVFDVTASIYQRADLPPGLMRQLRQLAREFRRDDLVRRNTPGVELRYPAKLICF